MIGKFETKRKTRFYLKETIFVCRYCYVCIGKAKGENLCFVCGNKGDNQLNRCEHCGKLFHEECLKNARQQRGKWLCVLCTANDSTALIASLSATNNNTKWVSLI
jgi:hypothetical protein